VWIAFVIAAYLLGAVPFALLIARAHGKDIRKEGSGNIGATNVGRVVGRSWGFLCLALDILKGFVPTLIASFVLVAEPVDAVALLQWIAVGVAAVLGHTFPVYLGFRGGKGVATTIGVGLGIWPWYTIPMVIALLAYAAVRYGSGIVSAGSVAIAIVFPAAVYAYVRWRSVALGQAWPLVAFAVLLGLLIVVRHRSNIARLFRGEEQTMREDLQEPGA
jgi:glycerol-3-phosphate acyltransferase PlsY